MSLKEKARLAKEASVLLASLDGDARKNALSGMALGLESNMQKILSANRRDLEMADENGLTNAMRQRLLLSEKKISDMADALRKIGDFRDDLGEIIETSVLPNGLVLKKVRVPFGVIGIIYESRPNVTSDAAGLCIKSGNAAILRGGKEARESNQAIVDALREGLKDSKVSPQCIQFVEDSSRKEARLMMNLKGLIDLLIPRGGPGLIRSVMENATIPVIETGAGNCHTYVDDSADLRKARDIAINAKISNPAVCNAMETLLVHEKIANEFLPDLCSRFQDLNVELRGCEKSRAISKLIKIATEEDWSEEYLGMTLAIKVVSSVDEAISHIAKYGTLHSEAIVTKNAAVAEKFVTFVDAAALYINASTRFTDGGEYGLGAEIGISTQKLHARGPMGVRELTTYKYVVEGDGHIR